MGLVKASRNPPEGLLQRFLAQFFLRKVYRDLANDLVQFLFKKSLGRPLKGFLDNQREFMPRGLAQILR